MLSKVTFSQRCRLFMETSTLHGLAEISHARKRSERVILVIFLIFCNVATFYGCFRIVWHYIKRPVATSYFIREADELQLPDITVCPFNRFDGDFLREHNISEQLAKYIEWSFFIMSPKYEFVDFKVMKKARKNIFKNEKQVSAHLDELNLSYEDFIRNASLSCFDVVKFCSHSYRPYNCCLTADSILNSMGQCFRVKGTNQTNAGYGSGIILHVDLPLEKYVLSENMLLNDGVLIKLTEPGKGHDFDAIFVPPGVHALLQLRATKLEFMDDPPRYSCQENPPDDYAVNTCFQQCILRVLPLKCNCRYVALQPENEEIAKMKVCRTRNLVKCGYRALHMAHKAGVTDNCRRLCETRCTYWEYQAEITYASYPSKNSFKHYGNKMFAEIPEADFKTKSLEELRQRRLIIELFYEKLEYITIKHFPSVTTDQFIANIGGQMSLWMGGSILSIIHLSTLLCFCGKGTRKLANNSADSPVS